MLKKGRSFTDSALRTVGAVVRNESPRPEDVELLCSDKHYRQLQFHGIAPVWYSHFSNGDGLSRSAYDHLVQIYQDALIFQLFCRSVLLELGALLAPVGPVVLLQGLALAEVIYGEEQLRAINDIDLYVPATILPKVEELFLSAGFCRYRHYTHTWVRGGARLDVHADLWGEGRIGLRRFLASSSKVNVQASVVYPGLMVPEPDFLAELTLVHGLKHAFSRYIWLLDVGLLQRRGWCEKLPPEQMAVAGSLLRRARCSRESSISKPGLRTNAAAVLVQLSPRLQGVGELLLALLMPSWRQTGHYLVGSLIPSRQTMTQMYGDRSTVLLVILRILSLVRFLIWPCYGHGKSKNQK